MLAGNLGFENVVFSDKGRDYARQFSFLSKEKKVFFNRTSK